MRAQMVTDDYLDCSVGRPCAVTPFGAEAAGPIYYRSGAKSVTSTIPPQISGMTKLTSLFACGSTVSVKLIAECGDFIRSCLLLF